MLNKIFFIYILTSLPLHTLNLFIGPDLKCPICHLVFNSHGKSNNRKSCPADTDLHELQCHQKDEKLLHVMSNIKTNQFQWECFRCKKFVATKEQLHMHQKGGLNNEKRTTLTKDAEGSTDSKNKDTDADAYVKVPPNGFDTPCAQGFQCLICKKVFSRSTPRAVLSQHMMRGLRSVKHVMSTKQSNTFKFKCDKCGYYALSLEHLNMHHGISSEHEMEKEEIIVLDYGKGTKRVRKTPNNDVQMNVKKRREEGQDEKKEETKEEHIEEKVVKGRSTGNWEKVIVAHPPQYLSYIGANFIDSEDPGTPLHFKITGFAKLVGDEELFFQYYDKNKYKNGPPRLMNNFEYTPCIEMANAKTSWIEWVTDHGKDDKANSVPYTGRKRGRKPKLKENNDNDKMKSRKAKEDAAEKMTENGAN